MTHDTTNAIPTVDLKDLFPGLGTPGDLVVGSALLGAYEAAEIPALLPHEQLVLAAIVRNLAPSVVVEFGTGRGLSTWTLAANLGPGGTAHTVDLKRERRGDYTGRVLRSDSEPGQLFHGSAHESRIRQILVDPSEPSPELVALAGKVGLFLIDGDHSYQGVRKDTEIAFELAAPDAVYVWHDFYLFADYVRQGRERRGVYPWLNEIQRQKRVDIRHINGTFFAIGRARWPETATGVIRQPGDATSPLGERIMRLGEF